MKIANGNPVAAGAKPMAAQAPLMDFAIHERLTEVECKGRFRDSQETNFENRFVFNH